MLNDAMAIRHQELMFDLLDWQGRNVRNKIWQVLDLVLKQSHSPMKLMQYNQHAVGVRFQKQPNDLMRQLRNPLTTNFLKGNLKLKNCKQEFRSILTAMKNSHFL